MGSPEVWICVGAALTVGLSIGTAVGRWLMLERMRSVLSGMKLRIGATKPWKWTVDAWAEQIDAEVTGRPSRVGMHNGVWSLDSGSMESTRG